MKKHTIEKITAIFIAFALVLSFIPSTAFAEDETADVDSAAMSMETMFWLVADRYYDSPTHGEAEFTVRELYDAAMSGMADALDPYTRYYSAEEAERLWGTERYGTGVFLNDEGGKIIITRVMKGSPAAAADLAGGIILGVNGKNTMGKTSDDIFESLFGPLGGEVVLHVRWENPEPDVQFSEKLVTLEFTDFYVDTVLAFYGDDFKAEAEDDRITKNLGYIGVHEYNDNCLAGVETAIETFKKAGVNRVMLDLRGLDNGGEDFAFDVCDLLIPNRKLFTIKMKDGEYYFETALEKAPFAKIIVVTDKYTGGAGELIASAVQTSKIGKVVGEKTKGDAVVSNWLELSYGGWLYYTAGTIWTPSGKEISYNGVTPDILAKAFKIGGNNEGESLRSLRRALNVLGFLPETLPAYDDAAAQKAVADAVSAFQKSAALEVTGKLNADTTNAINAAIESHYQQSRAVFEDALSELVK